MCPCIWSSCRSFSDFPTGCQPPGEFSDAILGLPVYGFTTKANWNDAPELPELLDGASAAFPWFNPNS